MKSQHVGKHHVSSIVPPEHADWAALCHLICIVCRLSCIVCHLSCIGPPERADSDCRCWEVLPLLAGFCMLQMLTASLGSSAIPAPAHFCRHSTV